MLEHTQLIADESAGARKILRLQSQSDSIHAIQREVAKHFGIQVEDITGPSRTQKYCAPRHIALWLCRELVKRENGKPVSLPTLGKLFGGRDHSTVLIALRRMQKEIEEGGGIAKAVLGLSGTMFSQEIQPSHD